MEDEAEQFSLTSAWEQVRVLLTYITSLFGAPADLAERLYLRVSTRFQILQWLAPLEALARRLLAIEALQAPPPNAPAPVSRVRDQNVASRLADRPPPALEDAACDPETWRVVFNLWPGWRAGMKAGGIHADNFDSPQGEPPLLRNALSLARRIEALRRLAENPEAALARMRRLLAARRGEAASRFTSYTPRKGLRANPAATLLAQAHGELALAFTGDTS